jgi:hypothetical protein
VHLVQVLLPLPADAADGAAALHDVTRELTEAFGGVTAYTRSPAKGRWLAPGGREERDDVVVLEIMVSSPSPEWWRAFRTRWEARLGQDVLVVRCWEIEAL